MHPTVLQYFPPFEPLPPSTLTSAKDSPLHDIFKSHQAGLNLLNQKPKVVQATDYVKQHSELIGKSLLHTLSGYNQPR